MTTLLIITFIIVIFSLFIWASSRLYKQSQNDWAVLHELEEKASKVKTKEEIISLHKELIEKGSKIYNNFVNARLQALNEYLRGLYQQYKK